MKWNTKIARKLSLSFVLIMLLFAVALGLIFILLFSLQHTAFHKSELESQADNIAATLSTLLSTEGTSAAFLQNGQSGQLPVSLSEDDSAGHSSRKRHGHGQSHESTEHQSITYGYENYMDFIDDIAMSDVWIVDRDLQLISRSNGQSALPYNQLPQNAEAVIEEVFEGATASSESFSAVLGAPTITAGAPITDSAGHVIGAVLLHSPVTGVTAAIQDGLRILMLSIILSLLLAVLLAVLLAYRFTRPLNQMKDTARKLAEGNYSAKTSVRQNDEIGELAQTIDILSETLAVTSKERERLEQMRRDFVSNVSHELRTPVTVLRGSLEALVDGVVTEPDQIEEYHQQMLTESIHLQRLVTDLLDLSRLQNQDFAIEMQPLDLCAVVEDVSRGMDRIAAKKRVALQLESDFSHCPAIGDYGRLRQMLMVVIDNAIKFSPEGGIVSISLKRPASSDAKTLNAILSISDHGPGIIADDIPYIFDRFHSANTEQNHSGTGLGLPIAKQIADRHGIGIQVESQPEVLTQFRFLFPHCGEN